MTANTRCCRRHGVAWVLFRKQIDLSITAYCYSADKRYRSTSIDCKEKQTRHTMSANHYYKDDNGCFLDIYKVPVSVLAAVSILCCLVTILAITIPLFDKEERKKMSAYNAYLVYLAIPDLVMSICFVLMANTCAHEYELLFAVSGIAFLGNVLVNVVILYEILKLLVDSKTGRRSEPPSLLRATAQAMVVYAASCVSGLLEFCLNHKITSYVLWDSAFVYIFWVLFRICYGRLLCYDSDTLGRLRVLVVYFSRIMCINIVTALFFIVYFAVHERNGSIGGYPWYFTAWLIIQIWIGFGLSLTKPDVLDCVRRLLSARPFSRNGSAVETKRDLGASTTLETSADLVVENESRSHEPEQDDARSNNDGDD